MRRRDRPRPEHLFVSGRRAPQLPAPESLHDLPESRLLERLQSMGGFPDVILREPELVDMFLKIIRADLVLHESEPYTDDPPLDCPISAFGGHDDPMASGDALGAWACQTTQAFVQRQFPGGHFYLQPQRDALLGAVGEQLAVAGRATRL